MGVKSVYLLKNFINVHLLRLIFVLWLYKTMSHFLGNTQGPFYLQFTFQWLRKKEREKISNCGKI